MTDPQPIAAPTRTVGITTTRYTLFSYREVRLTIFIDGVAQPAQWGRGEWILPADRSVTIAIMLFSIWRRTKAYGSVEYVLPPGGSIELEYKAPSSARYGPGMIGPVGTVQHLGRP